MCVARECTHVLDSATRITPKMDYHGGSRPGWSDANVKPMPKRKRSRSARRLSTPAAVAKYLSKAFKRGPNSVPLAIVTAARSTNMVHLARKAGVSRSNLYRLLEGERGDLKLRTALRLLNALGMKVEVKLKRKK